VIAKKRQSEANTERSLSSSRKIYVNGRLPADVRVPCFVIPSGVEGPLTIFLIK